MIRKQGGQVKHIYLQAQEMVSFRIRGANYKEDCLTM